MQELPKRIKGKSKAITKTIWYISIARNILLVLVCSTLAFILDPDFAQNHESNSTTFKLTGSIDSGLPSLTLPPYDLGKSFLDSLIDLGSLAFTFPLVAILGQIAIAKTYSKGQHLDANQELVALGIGNLLGSLVSAMPVTASFGRSAINKASGVRLMRSRDIGS